MAQVKKIYEARLKKVIEIPELANNIDLDQNKIMTVIIISYLFKTFKLVIIIFQVSYFIGILFYIYCKITKDVINGEISRNHISSGEEDVGEIENGTPNFIDYWL